MPRSRWLVPVSALVVAVGAATALTLPVHADDNALPPCPEIFTHGGYPPGDTGWEHDEVRQPNNPAALQAYKDMGSTGVEADLQMTKNGLKAVMWHNRSTYRLTGSKKDITDIWWATGEDQLFERTIENGPFEGEKVYTLRQFLDALYDKRMVPLIEFKGYAEEALLNDDSKIQDNAWSEILVPIDERIGRQEIMVYTHEDDLRPELEKRFTNAGLEAALSMENRPAWPDTVEWNEPPPSAEGNYPAWQTALDAEPARIATSWPGELHDWLQGKCE